MTSTGECDSIVVGEEHVINVGESGDLVIVADVIHECVWGWHGRTESEVT
jgi:hypothetical protein